MVQFGYALSSEEHGPRELVRHARRAEEIGFDFLSISDHYHPWIDHQGQSPFVWSVIGGIAATTRRIRLGTGVTCPIQRIHPAVLAQATATAAAMMPGRFVFGIGTGEALNEHVTGLHWPPVDVRLEMLEEAVEVIRGLWQGSLFSHRGTHYTVEQARLYTLPEAPPPVVVAASGPRAAEVAARVGDGLWNTKPDEEVLRAYRDAGGSGPRYGQVTVCWADDEAKARRTAHEYWPTAGLSGQLQQELALPAYFEQAASTVTEDMVAEGVACGPDPEKHLNQIESYVEAGFDHVYVHQIGPDQDGFFDFYAREVLPAARERWGDTDA